ncbi:hypothetical protein PCANB_002099 [Pneumocystis canis]|nr:hypothetical protein PCANB_002099 [Pneumocystis canis]
MNFTPFFSSNGKVGAVPSSTGSYLAFIVYPSRLIIRSTASLSIKRVINLEPEFCQGISFLQWSYTEGSNRILLADSKSVKAWILEDDNWELTISEDLGIKNIRWSKNGSEILIWTDFLLKFIAWSLSKHVGSVVYYPKFFGKGYDYRPASTHFVLITRSASHDFINIFDYSFSPWKLFKKWRLPTIDAQGCSWSQDGKWLAVWESFMEYKILLYTSNGYLLQQYSAYDIGLGIKTVQWSPPTGQFIAVGSFDGKVRFLDNFTSNSVIEMTHITTIRFDSVTVWKEVFSSVPEYEILSQPVSLPSIPLNTRDPASCLGVGILSFNNDGTLVATRSDNMPTILWIWSLSDLVPVAILIYCNPIKAVKWCPFNPFLLSIVCFIESKVNNCVYLWNYQWNKPKAILLPKYDFNVKWLRWLEKPQNINNVECIGIIIGDKEEFVIGYIIENDIESNESNNHNIRKLLDFTTHFHTERSESIDPDSFRLNLDSELIDYIIGKDDAVLMREAMNIITDCSQTLENKKIAFENLEMLVENIYNANNLANMNMWEPLIQQLSSSESIIRMHAASVCGTAVQNNIRGQEHFLNNGGLEKMLNLFNLDDNLEVRLKSFYAIASEVRNNLSALKEFCKFNGWAIVLKHLENDNCVDDVIESIKFNKLQKILVQVIQRKEIQDNAFEESISLLYKKSPSIFETNDLIFIKNVIKSIKERKDFEIVSREDMNEISIQTLRAKPPPEGFDDIEPTLHDFAQKMKDIENEPHENRSRQGALAPIFQIHHQRSRYIYDLYYKREAISKELYEWLLKQGYADGNLIAKWKKNGYEKLCCLRCIQTKEMNFNSTCICRVPKAHLPKATIIECVHCEVVQVAIKLNAFLKKAWIVIT